LIIKSHPFDGSFNAAMVREFSEAAARKGHEVSVIDLIADGFDPVMRTEDLRLWKEGKSDDPLVREYQSSIEKTDVLVFPFPVWWGGPPAILKGFCDKVLLPGWAWDYGRDADGALIDGKLVGMLTGKKAVIIATMETPTDDYAKFYSSPVENAFIKNTLELCGLEIMHFMQIDRIGSMDIEQGRAKLEEIKELV